MVEEPGFDNEDCSDAIHRVVQECERVALDLKGDECEKEILVRKEVEYDGSSRP